MAKPSLMRFLLLCLLLGSTAGYAQEKPYTYLIVQIQRAHDNGTRYYRILPEDGNPHAAPLQQLMKYSARLRNDGVAAIYTTRGDTSRTLFNYFTSISSALEYLDTRGWKLHTVLNEVNNTGSLLYTITSYYLRKDLP